MSATQQLPLSLNSTDEPLGLALRRACDRCRKRKSRCDGQKPCKSCCKVGTECSYLIAPKPLGRRPRKPRPTKNSQSHTQPVSRGNSHVALEATSKGNLEHVTPEDPPAAAAAAVATTATTLSGDSAPLTSPHETPDLSGFPLPDVHSNSFNMGLNTTGDWFYPPLSLYSPSDDGGLPFDVGLSTLTFGHDLQQYFPANTASTIENFVSPPSEGLESDLDWRLPTSTFVPYVKLFFERLYPVFPVLDRDSLPSEDTASDRSHATWDRYALHTSLAAAVTVQLNIVGTSGLASTEQPLWSDVGSSTIEKAGDFFSAEFWIQQALQARSQWDFMSNPSEATIMTSFFLFEYYGNKNQSQRAWYYLREAIGFALAIGLDDQETYGNLDAKRSQRLCRLFWLLFVTERYVSCEAV